MKNHFDLVLQTYICYIYASGIYFRTILNIYNEIFLHINQSETKLIDILINAISNYAGKLSLSQRKDDFGYRFYGRPKMADITKESLFLIWALLKCLRYSILKNCSYDIALSKTPHLPNVFVLL